MWVIELVKSRIKTPRRLSSVKDTLFSKEEGVLDRSQSFRENVEATPDQLRAEHSFLTEAYKRLLRQTRSLTRVSDRLQHKLQEVSAQLDAYLGRHVGQEIKKDILRNWGSEVRLQDLTIAFVDIRGYTSFAEEQSPNDVIHFLKSYYEYSLEIVHKYGGLVKSFMGDGVMLVFGYNQDEYTCDNAIRCALEILERLPEFNKRQNTNVSLGIGLHSGPTAVSSIGTKERTELAVIGNTVNMASRIESETKFQNMPLLFSREVREKLRDPPRKPVFFKAITLRGQRGEVELFTLEGLE